MHLNIDIASGRSGATSYRADFRFERINLPYLNGRHSQRARRRSVSRTPCSIGVRSCKIGRSETKIQGDPRGRIQDQFHPRARARHLKVVRPSFPVMRAPRPPRDPAEWPTLSALTPRPSPIPLSPGGGDENPSSPRPDPSPRPTTFCSVLKTTEPAMAAREPTSKAQLAKLLHCIVTEHGAGPGNWISPACDFSNAMPVSTSSSLRPRPSPKCGNHIK